MSHGVASITRSDIPDIVRAKPFLLPAAMRSVLFGLVVLGIVAFGYDIVLGDAVHAWTSLQVNFLYWLCLAAASTCFAAALHICNAQWSRPIRRLFEAGSHFFTMTPIFLVVLYFGHTHLFIWAREPIAG